MGSLPICVDEVKLFYKRGFNKFRVFYDEHLFQINQYKKNCFIFRCIMYSNCKCTAKVVVCKNRCFSQANHNHYGKYATITFLLQNYVNTRRMNCADPTWFKESLDYMKSMMPKHKNKLHEECYLMANKIRFDQEPFHMYPIQKLFTLIPQQEEPTFNAIRTNIYVPDFGDLIDLRLFPSGSGPSLSPAVSRAQTSTSYDAGQMSSCDLSTQIIDLTFSDSDD